MSQSPAAHVVRIDGPDEQPVGAACLLVDRKIITCAHVVADALGDRSLARADERPEGRLKVRFPFSRQRNEAFDAEVICWRRMCHEDERDLPEDGLSDVAMLLLAADPPADVRPADLIDDLDLQGQDFKAFGFPRVGFADWRGTWTKGRIGGRLPPTWFLLESTEMYGQKVRQGFSGGPVWLCGCCAVAGIIGEFVSRREMNEFQGVMIGVQALKRLDNAIAETLRRGQEELGEVHGAPSYLTRYVERPELIKQLRDRILGQERAVAVSGERGLGLHGMGGIGKTVLAAALARDDEIRRAFSGGIFWFTVGQNIDCATLQAQIHYRITGRSLAATDINGGRDELHDALKSKKELKSKKRRVLIIVDDVWQPQIAAAFPAPSEDWKILITTRIKEVIQEFGAVEVPVHLAEYTQALAILEQYAGEAFPREPAQRKLRDEILKETGKLPLALALVGTMARRAGAGFWPDILRRLKHARLDRIAASIPDYKTYETLLKTLDASVATLSEFERERYMELGVFAEDTPAPVRVLEILWGSRTADRLEVWELANAFVDRALASWTVEGQLALHDLQRDYIRATATDLPALHVRLVEAYRSYCPNGWASGPADGYFFLFLPQHLDAAGRRDELKALLADYDWIEAKLKASNAQSVVSDYNIIANEPELDLVQEALRLSIPALNCTWTHLPSQLIGRLCEIAKPPLPALLERASAGPGTAWLCPQTASLTPPTLASQTLVGPTESIGALVALPSDNRALAGSGDGTLRLWDFASGTSRVIGSHTPAVTALAVLPDGRALSGSLDGTVRLWDLVTGVALKTFSGHSLAVSVLAVLPDGCALSGSRDGTLRLWGDLASGTSRVLEGHEYWISALAALPDGRALSGSWDLSLRLWDLASGTSRVIGSHTLAVTALAVLPDGCVLSGCEDGLQLLDLASGTRRVLTGKIGWISALAALPDGRALSGSWDWSVILWDVAGDAEIAAYLGDAPITCVASAPPHLIAGAANGAVHILKLRKVRRRSFSASPLTSADLPH